MHTRLCRPGPLPHSLSTCQVWWLSEEIPLLPSHAPSPPRILFLVRGLKRRERGQWTLETLLLLLLSHLSRVRLSVTPRTATYQAPPPMGFSRQEYWSGVPLPSPLATLTFTKFCKKHIILKERMCRSTWHCVHIRESKLWIQETIRKSKTDKNEPP